MTLRRLIWLIVSVILILTPVQLQQNIPIPLAILCVSVGCFIGSYPDIVVCMRVWKKEGLSLKRNRAIIETIIYEVIWTAILVFDFSLVRQRKNSDSNPFGDLPCCIFYLHAPFLCRRYGRQKPFCIRPYPKT